MRSLTDILVSKGEGSLPFVKDFIAALVHPLQTNSDEMETYNNLLLVRSKYNGQKMIMQKAINEIFGYSENYVVIENNTSSAQTIFTYNQAEVTPVYISNSAENDPLYVLNSNEVSSDEYDFTVKVPAAVYSAALSSRIASEINKLKVVGTRYRIIQV